MQQNLQEGQKFVDPQTGDECFSVCPITNCPHALQLNLKNSEDLVKSEANNLFWKKCIDCSNIGENWICMVCNEVFCSRYVKGHMASHNQQNTDHFIALSFADLSFWCYTCDSYITNNDLSQIRKLFQRAKFNEGEFKKNENDIRKESEESQEDAQDTKNKIINGEGFFVSEDVNESKTYQTLILNQFPQDIQVQKAVLKGYGSYTDKNKKYSILFKQDSQETLGYVIRFNKDVQRNVREKVSFLINEIEGYPFKSNVSFENVKIGEEQLIATVYFNND